VVNRKAEVHSRAAPEDHERWLTCGYDEAVALQRPFPAERMAVRGPVFPTRALAG
jgi:putative SOS response-associated peptidase YedK